MPNDKSKNPLIFCCSSFSGNVTRQEIVKLLNQSGYNVYMSRGVPLNTLSQNWSRSYGKAIKNVTGQMMVCKHYGIAGFFFSDLAIGTLMATNKQRNIFAAYASSEEDVIAAKKDNDANTLCFPIQKVSLISDIFKLVLLFLETEYESSAINDSKKRIIRDFE